VETSNSWGELSDEMKNIMMRRRQIAGWAGMIGPAFFVAVFTIEGLFRSGYNALEMYVSALSLGPRGWIQMVNFVLFGILLLVFTWGVAAEFPNGKASRGGPILLTVIAICYLLSGPFVMDPTGIPLEQATVHGTLHGIFGAIVFLLMPISFFMFLRRFRVDANWRSFQGWTLLLGVIDALAFLFFTFSSKLPAGQNAFSAWFGLIQRSVILPFMLWIFVFALNLLKRSKQD
jgi:hypothetical protein